MARPGARSYDYHGGLYGPLGSDNAPDSASIDEYILDRRIGLESGAPLTRRLYHGACGEGPVAISRIGHIQAAHDVLHVEVGTES